MAQQERKQQQEQRLALKQERRALAQQGHRPYFLKKCEWGHALESLPGGRFVWLLSRGSLGEVRTMGKWYLGSVLYLHSNDVCGRIGG